MFSPALKYFKGFQVILLPENDCNLAIYIFFSHLQADHIFQAQHGSRSLVLVCHP